MTFDAGGGGAGRCCCVNMYSSFAAQAAAGCVSSGGRPNRIVSFAPPHLSATQPAQPGFREDHDGDTCIQKNRIKAAACRHAFAGRYIAPRCRAMESPLATAVQVAGEKGWAAQNCAVEERESRWRDSVAIT